MLHCNGNMSRGLIGRAAKGSDRGLAFFWINWADRGR